MLSCPISIPFTSNTNTNPWKSSLSSWKTLECQRIIKFSAMLKDIPYHRDQKCRRMDIQRDYILFQNRNCLFQNLSNKIALFQRLHPPLEQVPGNFGAFSVSVRQKQDEVTGTSAKATAVASCGLITLASSSRPSLTRHS